MKFAFSVLVMAGLGSTFAADRAVDIRTASEPSEQPGFWDRPQLTGDWGGARTWLTEHGLNFDLEYTAFGQGLFSGTGPKNFEHSGRVDLFFNIDTGKLGLWEGGGLRTHTEYRYGSLNPNPGAVLWPVNVGQVLPLDAPEEIVVSSLYLTQSIGERAAVMLGKINVVDLLASSPFYGGWGIKRFMNIALVAPPTGLVPPVIMGGIVSLRTDPINWTLMVYDPHDRARQYWPDDLFSDGVIVNLSATYAGTLAGRKTIYKIGGIYSTQEGINLRDTLLPPELVTTTKRGSYNVNFEFTHLLYENKDRPGDGWGFFVRGGFSDANPNPIQTFVSGGIGGKGLISSRPNDSFGVGYFYYNFSDELKSAVRPVLGLGDEQGGEIYYNFGVTPWFHVTADLQIIDPATGGAETAVVGALRGNVRF